MDDLVQWLRVQLDEDERIARAATAGPWSRMGQRVLDPSPPSDRLGVGMAVGHAAASADFNETADHIAVWDPARVLREIDAKRQLLDRYEELRAASKEQGLIGDVTEEYQDFLLRLLALPYADKPGYREEWAP
jgi:hypothetical protein